MRQSCTLGFSCGADQGSPREVAMVVMVMLGDKISDIDTMCGFVYHLLQAFNHTGESHYLLQLNLFLNLLKIMITTFGEDDDE